MRSLPRVVLGLAAGLGLAACAPDPVSVFIEADCEWSNPLHCMLPWPSDRWLVEDSSTPTGLRLEYDGDRFPRNTSDEPFDAEPYRRFDGFSPASTPLTLFPDEVDVSNLAWIDEYAESLEPDSPTVLVDLQTGERIAHFVEVDARAGEDYSDFASGYPVLFYLHPAQRLREATRYGVALRDIRLVDGSDAEAWPAFAALRDGLPTTSEEVEAARPSYESLFEGLAAAGVERESLVQAWSFTTASGETIRRDLLALREDALERVPAGGIDCVVTEVEEAPSEELARIVHGTFSAPLYMDADAAGSRLVRSPDGSPEFQGWIDAPFSMNIPASLTGPGAPQGRLIQFGHGLLGTAETELNSNFGRGFANDYESVLAGTNWQGMSREDITAVGQALADMSNFPMVAERLMQGMVNQWTFTRALRGACRELPELIENGQSIYSTESVYFVGISQGGILGGTFLATSPEIDRGALLVASMNFPFTMTRSLNWVEYEAIPRAWYPQRIDREFLTYALISMWDLAEPNAYLPHLVRDPLPGTPAKPVLYQVAEGDLQVQTIAADTAARTAGIPLLSPAVRPIWGLEEQEAPAQSGYVYYDLGQELPPIENLLPGNINSVHNDQRDLPAARQQIDAFLAPDGAVLNFCDGACDPE